MLWKTFKELGREYFEPIRMFAGDTLVMTFKADGKEACKVSKTVDRSITVNCGVLFEVVYEGRRGYGGMFLDQE